VADGEASLRPVEVAADGDPLALTMSASGSELAIASTNGVEIASAERDWRPTLLDRDICATGADRHRLPRPWGRRHRVGTQRAGLRDGTQ
jgi:hypothetical protein